MFILINVIFKTNYRKHMHNHRTSSVLSISCLKTSYKNKCKKNHTKLHTNNFLKCFIDFLLAKLFVRLHIRFMEQTIFRAITSHEQYLEVVAGPSQIMVAGITKIYIHNKRK